MILADLARYIYFPNLKILIIFCILIYYFLNFWYIFLLATLLYHYSNIACCSNIADVAAILLQILCCMNDFCYIFNSWYTTYICILDSYFMIASYTWFLLFLLSVLDLINQYIPAALSFSHLIAIYQISKYIFLT